MAEALARAFDGVNALCVKYAALIKLVFGAFWTAASVFLIVVAVIVFAQQSENNGRRAKEHTTLRLACERSRQFGPGLASFFETTQRDLDFEALSTRALEQYRATIPKHCPK